MILTMPAALTLVVHSLRRRRQFRASPEKRFRMGMTIGNDAIDAAAILLQLFPVLMMPVCA
ncbi:hypothetical protein GI374_17295 [Paracoccus sp. S-4012]|uniref:hypothetical protein n=1 Tax=Paracoccus sp. S-4012 TaxID=2665648 RepID=UPI0013214A62|nr:hypothetical protein [Paracoccus sp. S-4012]MRX52131.1 hypothetical protein [Paracoccus sp. S-4012]